MTERLTQFGLISEGENGDRFSQAGFAGTRFPATSTLPRIVAHGTVALSGAGLTATSTATIDTGQTGSNRCLWIAFFSKSSGAGNISVITYDGVAMQSEGLVAASGFSPNTELYQLVDPANNSNTLSVTFNPNHDPADTGAYFWVTDNTDQTTPVQDSDTYNSSASLTGTINLTTTVDNVPIMGGFAASKGSVSAWTPGAGYTEREDKNGPTMVTTFLDDSTNTAGSNSISSTVTGTPFGDMRGVAFTPRPVSGLFLGNPTIQEVDLTGAPASSINFTHISDPSADLVVIGFTAQSASNATTLATLTATYNGVSCDIRAQGRVAIDRDNPNSLWVTVAPQGGNEVVLTTDAGTLQNGSMWAVDVYGAGPAPSVGAGTITGTASGGALSESITTDNDGAIVFGAWSVQGTGSSPFTQSTDFTKEADSGFGDGSVNGTGRLIEQRKVATAGSVTVNASASDADGYVVAYFSLNPEVEGAVNLAAVDASVSGSQADLVRGVNLSGQDDSASDQTSFLLRTINASGQADSASGSQADLVLGVNLSGSVDSVSGQTSSLSAIPAPLSNRQAFALGGLVNESNSRQAFSSQGLVSETVSPTDVTRQIAESQTLTDSSVGALSKTFASTTVTQDDGAGSSGRYMLVALVAVSSASAGVTIDSVAYGSETLEPDAPGQETASGQPATRTFSAGSWPTGANDLVVTCSGGNIDSVVVYLAVIEEVADACLPAYGTGIVSDPLNRLSQGTRWNFSTGNAPTATATPVLLADGTHAIEIDPNDDEGEWYESDDGVLFYQTHDGSDFDIAVHFNEALTQGVSDQGILAWANGDDWVRFSRFTTNGSNNNVYFRFTIDNSGTATVTNTPVDDSDSRWLRLAKTGDDWQCFTSSDGETWTSRGSRNDSSYTVNRLGFYFVKASFTVDVAKNIRHFDNINGRRDQEDANTALEFLSTTAASATSVQLDFTEDTAGVGEGLIDLAIIAADDAAGVMTGGAGDELLSQGVVSSTDGIRYAIVGAFTPVSGTTSGKTVGASWSGPANASAAGWQFRVESEDADLADLSGQSDSASDSASDLSITVNVSGQSDSVSGQASDLNITKDLSASASAQSDQASDLSRTINASSVAIAISEASATVDVQLTLAASSDSVSDTSPTLVTGDDLQVVVTAVSDSQADLSRTINAEAFSSSLSDNTAALDITVNASGQVDATSDSSGSLQGQGALTALVDAVSDSTVDLQVLRTLSGTAIAVSSQSSDLQNEKLLASVSSASSDQNSVLQSGSELQAVSQTASGHSATLDRTINAGASSESQSSAAGSLEGQVEFSALVEAVSDQTSGLQVLRTLSGQAVAVSVSSADLQILKSLSASVDSLSSSTSSLSLGLSLSSSVIAQSGHSGSLAGEPQTVDNFIATFEDSQVFSASVSM